MSETESHLVHDRSAGTRLAETVNVCVCVCDVCLGIVIIPDSSTESDFIDF